MPCYDSRKDESIDLMARFCCAALSAMESFGHGDLIPDYIKEWWKNHKEFDASCGRKHKGKP